MGMIDIEFWKNKKVLVTGHTGFKGSWLCLWLHSLGAEVIGYGLQPPTDPSLFNLAKIDRLVTSYIGDIRNMDHLTKAIQREKPEIIFHMAAQPLVRESYKRPVETYFTNVLGTVHLLEVVRNCGTVRAVVNVTTDKCYENMEREAGYSEKDPLGGYDPYSSSKACSELVTSAYRNSFFSPKRYPEHRVAIASARAGNVIGGGDWASDRLIPDCIRSFQKGEKIQIRNPQSIRPWQHVLEPLSGYLLLAQKLYMVGPEYAEAWNFGPEEKDEKPVKWLVEKLCEAWPEAPGYFIDASERPHEANLLKLDCTKAKIKLGWMPRWNLDTAVSKVVEWTVGYRENSDAVVLCLSQIESYSKSEVAKKSE